MTDTTAESEGGPARRSHEMMRDRLPAELITDGSGPAAAGSTTALLAALDEPGGDGDAALFTYLRDTATQLDAARQAFLERMEPILQALRDLPAHTANQWVPIGPSVARRGQTANRGAMAGRVARIALAPGVDRVYAATANGGVWRSDDGGDTWRSMMRAFDVNPTVARIEGAPTPSHAEAQRRRVDSLSCGAIAIDPQDADRVWVGTGEGDGGPWMGINGIGMLYSADGGVTWDREPTATGSPTLNGERCYAIALDTRTTPTSSGGTPPPPQLAVVATTQGLYARESFQDAGVTKYRWKRTQAVTSSTTPFCDVVCASSPTATMFFAAEWGGQVYSSPDGTTWTQAGIPQPTGAGAPAISRVRLAMQPGNPGVVYALVAGMVPATVGGVTKTANHRYHGVYRLDTGIHATTWRRVVGPTTAANRLRDLFGQPRSLATDPAATGQGNYDIAIAVDPRNVNRLFVGGSYRGAATVAGVTPAHTSWAAFISRCIVTNTGTAASPSYAMTTTHMGGNAHADVHDLVVDPLDSTRLWAGSDGGVFLSTDTTMSAPTFASRNTGLANLMLLNLAQHPTQDAMIFAGTQDNGGLRFTGEEVWLHAFYGDCGGAIIDWNEPHRIAVGYTRFRLHLATDGAVEPYGGAGSSSWGNISPTQADLGWARFYPPYVGTPRNTATPSQSSRIAFGGRRVVVSEDFGSNWTRVDALLPTGNMFVSLIFASFTQLYGGTEQGHVYLMQDTGPAGSPSWGNRIRLDNLGAGPNVSAAAGFNRHVTDIAVDHSDASGRSIYVTYGARGDHRHVWHCSYTLSAATPPVPTTTWTARSGPSAGHANALLDIHFNAIETDSATGKTNHVYAGSDIGVWKSIDGGLNWAPFSHGLPDASVIDLKLHGPRRLLRAATHGRGAWEIQIDETNVQAVELYVRDTSLDQGRVATQDNLDDPTHRETNWPNIRTVDNADGVDIKVDVPSTAGLYDTPTEDIDFLEFVDVINDASQTVASVARSAGTVVSRVYVQVHNRGSKIASQVKVMCLLAKESGGLPALPADYKDKLRAGTPINTADWKTLGFETIRQIETRIPKIAAFELPSTMLPDPASLSGNDEWTVVALLHCNDDAFTSTNTDVDALSAADRKVIRKKIKVTQFAGTPAYPRPAAWVRIQPMVHNWPLCPQPPKFTITAETNGKVVIQLAWDPQALLAPSIGYDDAEALRYYDTSLPQHATLTHFEKAITKADGTAMQIRIPKQDLNTAGGRLEWTMPQQLWDGLREEATKTTISSPPRHFPCTLYYRVLLTPRGSDEAIAWPTIQTIRNNPDAPHLGVLAGGQTRTRAIPDTAAVAAISSPFWRTLLEFLWNWLPEDNASRQSLVRVFAHDAFRDQLTVAQRAEVLELWLVAGPTARPKIDQLLARRVWIDNDDNATALKCVDKRGGLTLAKNLLDLRMIAPHADLVGVTTNEQIIDDVITEILDPNGQVNQGDTGMGPPGAIQSMIIQVNPAEYVRLVRGLLSNSGSTRLANGDQLTIPAAIFQVARYGTAQSTFHARTNSELAFQAAILKYGQGSRFPSYDPSASPNAANGVNTVFQRTISAGLNKTEMKRVLDALWGVTFTLHDSGTPAARKAAFINAISGRSGPSRALRVPIVFALKWSPTSATQTKYHAVLAQRHESSKTLFKNPHYAGSSPPATNTAGASLSDPPRRVEDPNQALESISDSDLEDWLYIYLTTTSSLI